MRRREFIFGGAAAVWPLVARARQADKIRQIGFLAPRPLSTPSKPDAYYDAFVQKMKDLGYIEGKNLHIEWPPQRLNGRGPIGRDDFSIGIHEFLG